MKDTNICENCNHYLPFDCDVCAHCEQPMVLDSTGKLGLWRLGDIRDGILGHIAHELRLAFQFPVLIQPAYLDERPSARPTWKGLSSSVFLFFLFFSFFVYLFFCFSVFLFFPFLIKYFDWK